MKDDLKQLLGAIGKGLDTSTVFGETRVVDGKAIIPVATISWGGGGGTGSGHGGPGSKGDGEPGGEGEGEGMGLGFGVQAKPLGVIEVTADETRWVPIVDVAKLVATCVVGGVVVAMVCMATGCGGRCRG